MDKNLISAKGAKALDTEGMIRRLQARVEELEKDRGNAKRLVSKIWNQHPEARDTIEKATGAWLVFGQDVETDGVSAAVEIEGWKWMTHSDYRSGRPIPVLLFVEDGVTYYRPFDDDATDFEWDVRSPEWKEITAPQAQAVERGEVLVTVSGFTGSGKSAQAAQGENE